MVVVAKIHEDTACFLSDCLKSPQYSWIKIAASSGSKRCFEVSVPRGPDGLLVFRYVSERRASQWDEAINTHYVEADIPLVSFRSTTHSTPRHVTPSCRQLVTRESQVSPEQGVQLLHSHTPLLRSALQTASIVSLPRAPRFFRVGSRRGSTARHSIR